MSKPKHKTVIVGFIVAISLVFVISSGSQTFASEEYTGNDESVAHQEHAEGSIEWRKPAHQSVNNVMIIVEVLSHDGLQVYDTFTSFMQVSGFSNFGGDYVSHELPTFTLQGLVGPEKHFLYEMADHFYNTPISTSSQSVNKYANNKITINLTLDGIPIRSFDYMNCAVTDYYVSTLDDGIYTYQEDQGMGIAIVDTFEFQCIGYSPHNDYYNTLEILEKRNSDDNIYSSLDYKKDQQRYRQGIHPSN